MKHRVLIFSLFTFYMIAMTAVMIWQGIGIAPDRYAFVLLLGALFIKKTRSFLLDWIPFLFILVSYDFLRGFADNLSSRVHFEELIRSDLFFFGSLPTVQLQKLFYNPNNLSFLDYYSTIFYFLHFALPLAFGFLLWLYNRSRFREFVVAICLLSYAGWITYIVYPAAPPWLAQKEGYITGVTKIMDQTLQAFPERLQLPTIYHQFNPNPVAAIPSMHAAYPLLVFLYALLYFRRKALLFFPYVLSVWFAIVYLGEHYVVDIMVGAIFALGSFIVANQLHNNVKFHSWLKKTQDKQLVWSVRFVKTVTTLRKKIPPQPKIN